VAGPGHLLGDLVLGKLVANWRTKSQLRTVTCEFLIYGYILNRNQLCA
jgi:hypothetical protein